MGDVLKILFLSSEVMPYAKTGGLADVAGSLPGALRKLGVDVIVGLPFYRAVRENGVSVKKVVPGLGVPLNGQHLACDVLQTNTKDGGSVFFIDRQEFYDRPHLYGTEHGDYPDNLKRFSYFNRAALLFAREAGFQFDVVHCNDWQTGLAPAFLRTGYAADPFFSKAASVFTIHNMGYQGLFPSQRLPESGLPISAFHPSGVEYWGNISLLKAGIQYSDVVTTVSPTYSREIQTPEFGMGMEGILKNRAESLYGILNGADYTEWNPAKDKHLSAHYSLRAPKGKEKCKAALVRELDLDEELISRPLFAVISRLAAQKGFDLLLQVLEDVVGFNAGVVILAAGEVEHEKHLHALAAKHPSRIAVRIGFDEPLAHRMMAGADMILIPSRYEPCGLTQIYALRYGTVPIVRATGGLDDTIRQFNPETGRGTGFKFGPFEPRAFLEQIGRAVETFNDKDAWKKIKKNGMKADFSWEESAQKYVSLYQKIAGGRP